MNFSECLVTIDSSGTTTTNSTTNTITWVTSATGLNGPTGIDYSQNTVTNGGYYISPNTAPIGSAYSNIHSYINWANLTFTDNYTGNVVSIKGDAEIDGDLKIKGVSLSDRLDKIEERLSILRPNEELEAKWEELRELSRRYKEVEAEIKDKEKMWAILNK
jgi:hypothetical protein